MPQWSDPNSVVEPTRLALDVGTTEIKESKTTQDFRLELPFSQAGLSVLAEAGRSLVWEGFYHRFPGNMSQEFCQEIIKVSARSLTDPQRRPEAVLAQRTPGQGKGGTCLAKSENRKALPAVEQ